MTEAQLTPLILLELCGTGEMFLDRNNIGSGFLMRKEDENKTPRQVGARYGKYGCANPGGSDYIGAYRGRILYVEIKTPTGRQRPEQRQFQQKVQRHGCIYRIIRSVEEARAFLAELRARFGSDTEVAA